MRVYLGSDHAGYEFKAHLAGWLREERYEVVDHADRFRGLMIHHGPALGLPLLPGSLTTYPVDGPAGRRNPFTAATGPVLPSPWWAAERERRGRVDSRSGRSCSVSPERAGSRRR